MSKFSFKNIFSKFRFSRKKSRVSDYDDAGVTQFALPLSQYEENMLHDIVGNFDEMRIGEFKALGLQADSRLSNGETVMTFTTKKLLEASKNMEEAANKFHQNHWEMSSILDNLNQIQDPEILRAAAFLHSEEVLEQLAVPDEMKPQFTISQDKIKKMQSDNSILQASYGFSAAQKFFLDVSQTGPHDDVQNILQQYDVNDAGETSLDIFKEYETQNDQRYASASLASDHLHGANVIHDIMHTQPMTAFDLYKWSKNPILAEEFAFLADINFTEEMKAEFDAQLIAEDDDLRAQIESERAEAQELAEYANAGMNAIINSDPQAAKDVFEIIDANSVFEIEDGHSSFLHEASSVYALRSAQELYAQYQFRQDNAELFLAIELLEESNPYIHTVEEKIDNPPIYGSVDSAMHFFDAVNLTLDAQGTPNEETLFNAPEDNGYNAGDSSILLHKDVLDYLGIPEDERPSVMISAEILQDVRNQQYGREQALDVLAVTAGMSDDEISPSSVYYKLKEGAAENPFHAAAQIEMIRAIRIQQQQDMQVNKLITLHETVTNALEHYPELIMETVTSFAQDENMVRDLPFLKRFVMEPVAKPEIEHSITEERAFAADYTLRPQINVMMDVRFYEKKLNSYRLMDIENANADKNEVYAGVEIGKDIEISKDIGSKEAIPTPALPPLETLLASHQNRMTFTFAEAKQDVQAPSETAVIKQHPVITMAQEMPLGLPMPKKEDVAIETAQEKLVNDLIAEENMQQTISQPEIIAEDVKPEDEEKPIRKFIKNDMFSGFTSSTTGAFNIKYTVK